MGYWKYTEGRGGEMGNGTPDLFLHQKLYHCLLLTTVEQHCHQEQENLTQGVKK